MMFVQWLVPEVFQKFVFIPSNTNDTAEKLAGIHLNKLYFLTLTYFLEIARDATLSFFFRWKLMKVLLSVWNLFLNPKHCHILQGH